jgi:hypothetical protein
MIEDLAHRTRWRRRACRVLTRGRHWYDDVHEVDTLP